MAKVRDLASECSGAGYEYLGHMCDPEILRKGHNTDDTDRTSWGKNLLGEQIVKNLKSMGKEAPAAAPSGPYRDKNGTDWSRNADGSKK